jgi:hypothetical protein
VFRVKLAAIAIGLLNVAILEFRIRRGGETVTTGIRVAAGVSLVAWLAVASLGRLIAYF